MAFNELALGAKVPVPLVVHTPPLACSTLPLSAPFPPLHILISGPAFTIGTGLIVIAKLLELEVQGAFPLAVSVSVRFFAIVSAVDGK